MYNLSRGTTFPTILIVRTAKTQIILRIREARPDRKSIKFIHIFREALSLLNNFISSPGRAIVRCRLEAFIRAGKRIIQEKNDVKHPYAGKLRLIFCDQPHLPAHLSVTFLHVHQAATLCDMNKFNRGPSKPNILRW